MFQMLVRSILAVSLIDEFSAITYDYEALTL